MVAEAAYVDGLLNNSFQPTTQIRIAPTYWRLRRGVSCMQAPMSLSAFRCRTALSVSRCVVVAQTSLIVMRKIREILRGLSTHVRRLGVE